MINFAFLRAEWPELHGAASKVGALAELDALFATLQHRAFREELRKKGSGLCI
jgi:hypothetical protein